MKSGKDSVSSPAQLISNQYSRACCSVRSGVINMRRWGIRLSAALVAAAVGIGVARVSRTADHRDAPGISEDVRADLADVYSFVNPNNGNIVLAMTVNPFTVPGAIGVNFSPN